MKHIIFTCIFIIITSLAKLSPVSMVYNFRVAQITKQETTSGKNKTPLTLMGLIFDVFGLKENTIHQNYVGGLGSLIYDFKPYYFRADCAVAGLYETSNGIIVASSTKFDDILFTCGRTVMSDKYNMLNVAVLFGIPTHKNFVLEYSDFGICQIGMGAQVDGSYAFSESSGLIYGVRQLYFVSRNAPYGPRGGIQKTYKFTIGNISDILIGYKKDWRHQGVEIGYTLKPCYGAKIYPALDEQIQKNNYIRSNFYAAYKYNFLTRDLSHRLVLYSSYSFDTGPSKFEYSYLVSIWGSWSVSF